MIGRVIETTPSGHPHSMSQSARRIHVTWDIISPQLATIPIRSIQTRSGYSINPTQGPSIPQASPKHPPSIPQASQPASENDTNMGAKPRPVSSPTRNDANEDFGGAGSCHLASGALNHAAKQNHPARGKNPRESQNKNRNSIDSDKIWILDMFIYKYIFKGGGWKNPISQNKFLNIFPNDTVERKR